VKAGFHIVDTSRHWKPIISAASKVSSTFLGGTGRQKSAKIESIKLSTITKTTSMAVLRHTYPSSTSSTLWRTTSWVGRPNLRYSDHIKSVLRKCNIPESQLEALAVAEDKVLWRCATGLKNLAAAAEQAASDRRARRHAAATATSAGPVCPHCGTICASDFGLRSPFMTVQHTNISATSSSKTTDYYKQTTWNKHVIISQIAYRK